MSELVMPPKKKKIIQGIVNVFETDNFKGDYSDVTLIDGDSGGLTYGKAQTTLNSGNLEKLLDMYLEEKRNCAATDKYSVAAVQLEMLMPEFRMKNKALNQPNMMVRSLLRFLGQDPVMRLTQDKFFDQIYYDPAAAKCNELGLTFPLSWCIVYDSYIHGSFGLVRRQFGEKAPSTGGDEKAWAKAYVNARRKWLAGHSNPVLHPTVYRMDSFMDLIISGNWNLDCPLKVRSIIVRDADIMTVKGVGYDYTMVTIEEPVL